MSEGLLQQGWNRVQEDDTSLAIEILQGYFCAQIRAVEDAAGMALNPSAF